MENSFCRVGGAARRTGRAARAGGRYGEGRRTIARKSGCSIRAWPSVKRRVGPPTSVLRNQAVVVMRRLALACTVFYLKFHSFLRPHASLIRHHNTVLVHTHTPSFSHVPLQFTFSASSPPSTQTRPQTAPPSERPYLDHLVLTTLKPCPLNPSNGSAHERAASSHQTLCDGSCRPPSPCTPPNPRPKPPIARSMSSSSRLKTC